MFIFIFFICIILVVLNGETLESGDSMNQIFASIIYLSNVLFDSLLH